VYELYNLKTLVYTSVVPPAPVIVVALILIFFLTAIIERYLSAELPSISNDVILTPKSLNLKANELKTIKEFKLYGKQYIWCKALTKTLKNTK
jgi:hypothetical protein